MERSVHDRMNELEPTHWWFVARRKVIAWANDRRRVGLSLAATLEKE